MPHPDPSQAREFEDPPGLLEKTEFLLRDWVNMYHRYPMSNHNSPLMISHSPSAGKDSTKAFTIFVQQMNLHGLLKTDDLITRWVKLGHKGRCQFNQFYYVSNSFQTFTIHIFDLRVIIHPCHLTSSYFTVLVVLDVTCK